MNCDLQAAYDAINSAVKPNASERDLLVAAKCRGLMAGYHARWNGAPYEVEAVERFVDSEIFNPATGRPSRKFKAGGKIDVVAIYRGTDTVIVDHKTTSDDISDPDSPFWRQLQIDSQSTHYMYLEWMNARKASYALWDVVHKPSISPKNLSKAEQAAVVMTRRYCQRSISDESVNRMTETGRETLEMYEMRLAQDCTETRPNWYFQRRLVPRLDNAIKEHAQELWDHAHDIALARKDNRHPKNAKACMLYGSPCKFLGICSNHDTPDSDKWRRKTQVHSELPIVGADGRNLITHSRMGSFALCRRKHFYEYELGIERVDDEEKESLFFGTIFHHGQEGWWLSSKAVSNSTEGEETYGSNYSSPLHVAGGERGTAGSSATDRPEDAHYY